MPIAYSPEARAWQDQFETRALADRLSERAPGPLSREARAAIEAAEMFFLATADAEGRPQVSFKGGAPGFVTVVDDCTLAFPNYDGNGQFLSLGNLTANPNVGLLFIDFERPYRRRVNGVASIDPDDSLLPRYPGALAIVRVAVRESFGNCPRYIPKMQIVQRSKFVPDASGAAPLPKWKRLEEFQASLPPRDKAAVAASGEAVITPQPGQSVMDLILE